VDTLTVLTVHARLASATFVLRRGSRAHAETRAFRPFLLCINA
jgi:hypothetical protein